MITHSGSLNNTDVFDSEKFINLISTSYKKNSVPVGASIARYARYSICFFRDLMRIYLLHRLAEVFERV